MKRAIFIATAAAVVFLVGYTQWAIFYNTPLEKSLLFNQKIFYWHVPCWFVLFTSVIICGVASLLYLKRRDPKYDDIAEAAGVLAVLFGALGLITGSIWGRAEWGVWWQWDARLTTSLLLWMIMLGYVLVRKYGGPSSDRLAAGLAVFGAVDVPLIYFSVKIWRTTHPKATVVRTLDPSMKAAFWLSVLMFFGLYFMLLSLRVRDARAHRRLNEARELGLDSGLLE
jgi:heme exporter protein C